MNTLFSLLSSIDDFRLFTVVLDMYGGIHTYIHTGTYAHTRTHTHTHTHIQQNQAGRQDCVRVYGNLSQDAEVRKLIIEKKSEYNCKFIVILPVNQLLP